MSLLRNQRITRLDRLVHPARIRRVGRGLVLLVFLVSNPVGAAPTAASQGDPAIPGPDLFFERNLGQFPASVRYLARGPGNHVLLDDEGAVYDLGALDGEAQVRLTLDGGRAPEALVASSPLPGRLNYYLGNEPASWVAGAISSNSIFGAIRPVPCETMKDFLILKPI